MPYQWNLSHLNTVPEVFPAPGFEQPGLRALFYEGEPWHGRPTRVFAWYGAPSVPAATPCPAMVLVHGGGGSAFAEWVKLWNSRGYAAIAMDLNGLVPVGEYNKWQRHEWGGPAGISAADPGPFHRQDEPLPEQWHHHAVAAVIRAHSLLRSMPGVDQDRIGITGISWGGYLTCITAGIDPRFRFAVPVYGCGFVCESPAWRDAFTGLGPAGIERWNGLWDPKQYLPNANLPMLWVTGTNDFAYLLPLLQKSYRLTPGPRTLCVRVRMPHGHGGAGENPEEIHVFANAILRHETPLPKIVAATFDGTTCAATYEAAAPLLRAELTFTRSRDPEWPARDWETAPATLDAAARRVTAPVPADASAFYLNLFDARDCCVSTEHVERP